MTQPWTSMGRGGPHPEEQLRLPLVEFIPAVYRLAWDCEPNNHFINHYQNNSNTLTLEVTRKKEKKSVSLLLLSVNFCWGHAGPKKSFIPNENPNFMVLVGRVFVPPRNFFLIPCKQLEQACTRPWRVHYETAAKTTVNKRKEKYTHKKKKKDQTKFPKDKNLHQNQQTLHTNKK